MKQSPLAKVKESYKDKAGLIKAVRSLASGDLWVDRVNEDKGMERISNAKLLRLHQILSEVKSRFGSRKGLIDAIVEKTPVAKTQGYRESLDELSTPRLFDKLVAAEKRSRKAAKKTSN